MIVLLGGKFLGRVFATSSPENSEMCLYIGQQVSRTITANVFIRPLHRLMVFSSFSFHIK